MRTITIITLYDDDSCDHFVGAVDGMLSPEQKAGIAARLNATLGPPDEEGEDGRTVGFRVTELMEQAGGQIVEDVQLKNIWPDGA